MTWWSITPPEPPTWAPWAYYSPSEHADMAFTADECALACRLADELTAAKPGNVGTATGGNVVDVDTRDVEVRRLEFDDATAPLFAKLSRAVTSANAGWWRYELTHLLNLEVLRYGPGQHYLEHMDWGAGFQTRKLSASVMLSPADAYEGGDLELRHGINADVAPRELGTVIVFPSWLLHRVTPVASGERRTMTAWVQGPPFR